MALEDDRWSLEHLKEVDDRGQTYGVGSFRWRSPDGLVHRVVFGAKWRGWSKLCDDLAVSTNLDKTVDPGAITCFQCIARGA